MRKWIGVAGLVLLAGGGVGGWLAYDRVHKLIQVPGHVIAAERALALPGLVALANINVESLVLIDETIHGRPEAPPIAPGPDASALARQLHAARIDPRRDLTHAVAAAYSSEDGVGLALILFGSFDPPRFENALRLSPDFEVEETLGERGVLYVQTRDEDTCELSRRWAIHPTRNRIVISDPSIAPELLKRVAQGAPASPALAGFQEFHQGKLVSLAVLVPESPPEGIENPMISMATEAAFSKLDGLRALFFGASVQMLPPGVGLEMMLETLDPSTAGALAESLGSLLQGAKEEWSRTLPTVATLQEALTIEREQNGVRLYASLDREWASHVSELPGEILKLMFGQGVRLSTADSGASVQEQIDEAPRTFAAHYPFSKLSGYDPSLPFSGPVDVTVGPFGIRMSSLALTDDPDSGLEAGVEGIGARIGNVGEEAGNVRLYVTSVKDLSGKELLREELCGKDRNSHPADLAATFGGEVLQATKKVRLVPGATSGALGSIRGHVELRLPVRTESVLLSRAGEIVERNGVQLEITEIGKNAFSYSLSGEARHLLHMRALNRKEEPLQKQSGSQMDALFGSGRSGTNEYVGEVALVEAIFATEEKIKKYPFELTKLRPGTQGEHTVNESVVFAEYSSETLLKEFGRALEGIFKGDSQPRAVTQTGPFVVILQDLGGFFGLTPRLEVRAPEIPSLASNLHGLELAVRSLRMKDGTVHRPSGQSTEEEPWQRFLQLGKSYGEDGLSAQTWFRTNLRVDPDEVKMLSGVLTVRLPSKVSNRSLQGVELGAEASETDLRVVLSALGRDSFTLSVPEQGERLLGVRAFNAEGAELWIPGSSVERGEGGLRATFQVKGIPQRIEAVIADELDRVDYGFSFNLKERSSLGDGDDPGPTHEGAEG